MWYNLGVKFLTVLAIIISILLGGIIWQLNSIEKRLIYSNQTLEEIKDEVRTFSAIMPDVSGIQDSVWEIRQNLNPLGF